MQKVEGSSPFSRSLFDLSRSAPTVGLGSVPRISHFYGITIRMYWNEQDHPVPHFHAEYAGEKASISIDGGVLAGSIPPRALRLVEIWARSHRDELLSNWQRARKHEPMVLIDPLS
jgi:hypothetical protein